MELKFIWAKEFKILKNFGLNFDHSGESFFNFENNELTVSNKIYRKTLFGDQITGLTAIAGQNGSGKTSIMELILRLLATNYRDGTMSYYSDLPDSTIVCIGNYIIYKGVSINNLSELKEKNYTCTKFERFPLDVIPPAYKNKQGDLSTVIRDTRFMYYSNSIDERSGVAHANLSNLSTDYFIDDTVEYGYKKTYLSKPDILPYESNFDLVSPLRNYYLINSRQTIEFLLFSNEYNDLISNIGELTLRWNYSGNNAILDSKASSEGYKAENTILNSTTRILSGTALLNKLKKLLSLNLLRTISFLSEQKFTESDYQDCIEKLKLPIQDDSINQNYRVWLNAFENIFKQRKMPKKPFGSYTSKDIIDRYEGFSGNPYFYLLRGIKIDFNNQFMRDELKKFFLAEKNIIRPLQLDVSYSSDPRRKYPFFLDIFPTTPLSAGQQNYLNLYTRLKMALTEYDYSNFIILLDEPETSFHPIWKRNFLNNLVEFLTNNYPSKRFQIIITSHSPYILSDITQRNVRLLQLEEGKTKLLEIGKVNTFCANIHELLANSFFLKGGTIGDFAKNKLESLIKFLNSKESGKWDQDSAQELIDEVGDPIIKARLKELYYKKFGLSQNLDDEEERLKQVLSEIRRRKKG